MKTLPICIKIFIFLFMVPGITISVGMSTAHAQGSWPAKPIHLVVPVSPGGVVDLVPRVLLRKY